MTLLHKVTEELYREILLNWYKEKERSKFNRAQLLKKVNKSIFSSSIYNLSTQQNMYVLIYNIISLVFCWVIMDGWNEHKTDWLKNRLSVGHLNNVVPSITHCKEINTCNNKCLICMSTYIWTVHTEFQFIVCSPDLKRPLSAYLYNDICQDTRQDKIGSDEVYDAEQ